MPWMETDPMTQRMEFVMRVRSGLYSMSEACRRSGVSRKTGHKIWNRWLSDGVDGLRDRSRRPHTSPTRTPRFVEELIIDLRQKHRDWGPKKLTKVMSNRFPDLELPAPSTIAAILKREGLVKPRKRQRKHTHPGQPFIEVKAPNHLWTTDFKGHFRTGNGVYCYPLTVADQHSRYILACEGLLSTRGVGVRPVFEKLFKENGLPDGILSDNGVPFATRAIHGLSTLNVWWMQLGIRHFRIEPGKPQQNGRHERMHRTLKAPEYPGHYMPRLVCNAGTFRFKSAQIFISCALVQQYIGLEEIDDGIWSIYYYDTLLARYDERDRKLIT